MKAEGVLMDVQNQEQYEIKKKQDVDSNVKIDI